MTNLVTCMYTYKINILITIETTQKAILRL